MWTKLPNTCTPHRPQPPWHRIPSALPPSPSTLPFFLSFSFLHLFLCTWRGQEELRLLLPWQRRLGQAFTSPLPPAIISLIWAPHPAPPPPLLLFTPPIPPFLCLSCLWHPPIGLDWSEERRGRNSRTTLNFWPLNSVNLHCRLPVSWDTPSVCFRDNNTGFFAFARTGTRGLKKQQRWSSCKPFVTALLYGSDSIACRSLSLPAFTNIKDSALIAPSDSTEQALRGETTFPPALSTLKILISDEKTGTAVTHLYILKSDGDAGGCYRLSPVWEGKQTREARAGGKREQRRWPRGLRLFLLVWSGLCWWHEGAAFWEK